jgi:FixJ family two-component response regulator
MIELSTTPIVYIVDDDAPFVKALSRVLHVNGWSVETFNSAEAFMQACDPNRLACLVLDVNLPGLDGMALQRTLVEARQTMPIIFLTGCDDLPTCVEAVKSGASDFLTKPVTAETLLTAVSRAVERERTARLLRNSEAQLGQRYGKLTARERQVLEGIAAGRLNKQIAAELGITEQTVKFHRARIMERMEARSASELMRMAAKLAIGEQGGPTTGRPRPGGG